MKTKQHRRHFTLLAGLVTMHASGFAPVILAALVPLLAGCDMGLVPRLSSKAKVPVFSSENYPPDRFKTTQAEYTHGKARIRIAHAKRVTKFEPVEGEHGFSYCRAWLSVSVDSKVVFERVFSDIDALGYLAGIFLPKRQPPGAYFALVKHGDYDGRLILIDRNGSVKDLPGGYYFVTAGNLLFNVQSDADGDGFSVLDLETGKILAETTCKAPVQQWYRIGDTIGYTASEWLEQNRGYPSERGGEWYVWNSSAKRIVRQPLPDEWRSAAKRIDYEILSSDTGNCECAASK